MPAPGHRVGPYELLSPIGAGGMGEVWKARDTRLDRTVAVKFSQAAFTARFHAEARAIAALNHPNVATVYDVGENYLVMEYVDGEPIEPPNSNRKLLDIGVQIADGLAAAHAAGIIHRDLKPGNILLTRNGRIKILDFGLAKQTIGDDITQTIGTIAGTPAYMSPEQARGEALDTRSDQFSVGLVLYELATGKRAFQRASAAETLTAIIHENPEPLPTDLPAPLRWLIERCLAKEPESRYDTTRGLLLELRTIRERLSETTTPAPVNLPARSRRWVKRLPWGLAAVGALFLFLRTQAAWSPDLSKLHFVPFATEDYPEYGAVWSPDGRSMAYSAIAGNEFRIIIRNADGSAPTVLARHPSRIGGFLDLDNVSWSADGTRIYYILRGRPYFVARAGGAPQAVPADPNGFVHGVVPAPDGSLFAVIDSSSSGGQALYSVSIMGSIGAKPDRVLLQSERPIGFLSWAPDSSRLLVNEPTGTGIRLLSIHREGTRRTILEVDGASFMRHAWLPGGRYAALITSPSDQGIRIVDTNNGDTTAVMPAFRPFGSISGSPDGTRLAVTEGRGRSNLMEIPLDGGAPRPFLSSSLSNSQLAWSPSGDEFAYVQGESIRIRNRAGTHERLVVSRRDFPGYLGALQFEKPSFSPDGQRIVYTLFGALGRARGIWISSIGGGTPALVEKADGFAPVWLADGAHILFNPPSRGIWKYRLGSEDAPIQLTAIPCDPSPSPDGKWFLCAWSATIVSTDGKETRQLSKEPMMTGTWSKDSASVYVLNSAAKQELLQIDIATGRSRTLSQFAPPIDVVRVHRMALSPDGKSVTTTVRQNQGDIWILEGFPRPRSLWERLWPW